MMKIFYQAAIVLLVFSVTMPHPAIAQNRVQDKGGAGAAAQPARAASKQDIYRGSKIIGADLRDPQDKKLGEIEDLLLDSRRGEIAYVIVRFGGVMGMGGKYHPIPWKALQASDNGKYYVLYADRETISKAPGFDRGKWPDLANQKWNAEVENYWNRMVGQGPSGGITTGSGNGSTGSKGDAGGGTEGALGRDGREIAPAYGKE